MKKTYLVVVDSEYVRDVQITNSLTADHTSEDWNDTSGQLVLGTVEALSEEEARRIAAHLNDVTAENLTAYLLAPSPIQIGIRMEGGIIQSVFTDHPSKVVLIDYDINAYDDDEDLIEMQPRSEAYVSVSQANVMPQEFVDLKAILEKNNRSFE